MDFHNPAPSLPCDFWPPPTPLRNALYRNNRGGTCTDATQKAGIPCGGTFIDITG